MFNRVFNSQAKTIGAAAGILAISAFISRILGLIREGLLASAFGAGPELDSYFAAFRIPDLVYNILIAGGIVVAFLPLFSEYFAKDEKEAWRFTNNALNVFLSLLILLCLALFAFTTPLVKLITPGFNPQQIDLTVLLTRLMFLSPILFGLSSIFSGVLQYFNRFLVYSFCPILYNLGIIFGIIFFVPQFGVLGVALGVILGAVLYLLIQILPAINCGFKYSPFQLSFKDPGIKRVFILMLPRIFAITGLQINLIVITAIASTLAVGSVAIFNFANNLQNFPVGIIGVSFAVAAFPVLARAWAGAQKAEFLKSFSLIFCRIIYFIIPVSVLIFILKNQIVGIILRHGQFAPADAQLTAASLGLFSFGILALSLVPLLSRAFFAFQDTKTPTMVTLVAMVSNIALSFYFVWLLKTSHYFNNFLIKIFSLSYNQEIAVLGLPLAFSVGATLHCILLMIYLYRRIGNYNLKEIGSSASKIILASFLMALGTYLTLYFVSPILDGSQAFSGFFGQAVVAGIAAVLIYIAATFLLGSPETKFIKSKWKTLVTL